MSANFSRVESDAWRVFEYFFLERTTNKKEESSDRTLQGFYTGQKQDFPDSQHVGISFKEIRKKF